MSNIKQYTISKIVLGSRSTPELFNDRYTQIENALNDLSSRLSGVSNKSAVIQYLVALADNTSVGDIVYYNTDTAKFTPAIAKLRDIPGRQGQSIEAASSRILGIIISTSPATILRSGYWLCTLGVLPWIESTIGVGAQPGLYYLSASLSGHATLNPGWNLRQPCLSYYGDGKFSLITNYLAHDNHHHAFYSVLQWMPCALSESSLAEYNYKAQVPETLGLLGDNVTAVFYKGNLNTTQFHTKNYFIYTSMPTAPAENLVVIFNNYPFAYGDSVVRDILSNTLQITRDNGIIAILDKLYTSESDSQISNKAISRILGSTIYTTPIIPDVLAGLGITVKKDNYGKAIISSIAQLNSRIQATDVINNGTQLAVSGLLSYLVFPNNLSSNAVFSMPYIFSDAVSYSINFWCTAKGPGTNTATVLFYFMPKAEPGKTKSILPVALGSTSLVFNNSSTVQLQGFQTNSGIVYTPTQDGTIIAKVSANPTNGAILLNTYGFILGVN